MTNTREEQRETQTVLMAAPAGRGGLGGEGDNQVCSNKAEKKVLGRLFPVKHTHTHRTPITSFSGLYKIKRV